MILRLNSLLSLNSQQSGQVNLIKLVLIQRSKKALFNET